MEILRVEVTQCTADQCWLQQVRDGFCITLLSWWRIFCVNTNMKQIWKLNNFEDGMHNNHPPTRLILIICLTAHETLIKQTICSQLFCFSLYFFDCEWDFHPSYLPFKKCLLKKSTSFLLIFLCDCCEMFIRKGNVSKRLIEVVQFLCYHFCGFLVEYLGSINETATIQKPSPICSALFIVIQTK